MKNEKFTYIDSLSEKQEIVISDSDFNFTHKASSIHDVAKEGKPTTFLKDSMHRFVKNKSSVVGGVILGAIILLAIFVPIVMPNTGSFDVSKSHLINPDGIKTEIALPPKLFENAGGFWDGTIQKNDIVYDQENDHPVGFDMRTVSNLVKSEYYLDYEGTYGMGGFLNLTFKDTLTDKTLPGDVYSYKYDYDFNFDYTFNYRFLEPTAENYSSTKYRISLITLNSGVKTYYPLTGTETIISPFTIDSGVGYVTDYVKKDTTDTLSLDVSKIMKERYGITSLAGGRINIDAYREEVATKSSVYIENLLIETNDTNTSDDVTLRQIKNANHTMIQEQKITNGDSIDMIDNPEFWKSTNGSKSCLNVKYMNCNFKYDAYEDCYGDKEMTLPAYKINEFINGGYLNYYPDTPTTDKDVLASRYESLNTSKNPIIELIEQKGTPVYSTIDGGFVGYSLVCKVSQWKYLGYSSKPVFLFGTDGNGRDFLKTIFTSLRTSLLIAFGCSIINILFGIIWGSISGYFGGWTDILMERFVDIVGGLPSIAIITLALLYLHNDILAFIISMFMTSWMGVAGRTRTQFYRYKNREYVLASRTLGAKDPRLIFKHILPNALGTIITSSILLIPSTIYSEASIAYLGLGLKGQLMFGVILSENRIYFSGYTMYLLVIPTLIMALLLVAFNLFGNGLRDAVDPSLKGESN
jgi:ABC-type dipeptide/oligopeptide/nickel transport system permease subunit